MQIVIYVQFDNVYKRLKCVYVLLTYEKSHVDYDIALLIDFGATKYLSIRIYFVVKITR